MRFYRPFIAGLGAMAFIPMLGWSQAPPRANPPKLEPIAETKLLMEGLAQPNFRAIDRLLKEEPADAEGWQFGRGQALLIAETANLLMLRPPKGAKAEEIWMARATELRDSATKLARATAAKDLVKSRAALGVLVSSCNRCHEAFRIEVRIKVGEQGK